MRRFFVLAVPGAIVSLTAVGAVAAYRAMRPWYLTWGADPDEAARLLPGDELIAAPTRSETRAITIAAPEAAVWPWLAQMGYGRGGWYSYRPMDMPGPSADAIIPELQSIAVGETMPTSPDGGFEVVQIEPDHALVLYMDDVMVERQRVAARERRGTPDAPAAERIPPGLAASGAILGTTPSMFRATWSFVLEPVDGGSTRLIERVRVQYTPVGPMPRMTSRFLGFGLFVMMRRQLLGLKARAERLIGEGASQPPHETHPVEVGPQEVVPA
jgi:hypothetical protein